jgi:phosphoglycolate phosphatase-like HAD superfamily hydrolase
MPSLSDILVIFDCDGVLVDGERLAVAIDVRAIGALGGRSPGRRWLTEHLGRSNADVPTSRLTSADRCRQTGTRHGMRSTAMFSTIRSNHCLELLGRSKPLLLKAFRRLWLRAGYPRSCEDP